MLFIILKVSSLVAKTIIPDLVHHPDFRTHEILRQHEFTVL